MKAIKARTFFLQNIKFLNLYLLAIEAMPAEGGYKVGNQFHCVDNFDEYFQPIPQRTDIPLPTVPVGYSVKQICRGDTINIDRGLRLAEVDGFVLTLPEGRTAYYADSVFRNMYEIKAPPRTDGGFLIIEKSGKIFEGIKLVEDTIFNFNAGEHRAEAGSFIYKNPKDEDGYSICSIHSNFSSIGTFVELERLAQPNANIPHTEAQGWNRLVM